MKQTKKKRPKKPLVGTLAPPAPWPNRPLTMCALWSGKIWVSVEAWLPNGTVVVRTVAGINVGTLSKSLSHWHLTSLCELPYGFSRN